MPFAIDPGIIGVSIPIFALSIPIIAILSGNWRKAKISEHRAITIQTMLDKGFSPDEIERVMRASDGVPDKLAVKADRRHRCCDHA